MVSRVPPPLRRGLPTRATTVVQSALRGRQDVHPGIEHLPPPRHAAGPPGRRAQQSAATTGGRRRDGASPRPGLRRLVAAGHAGPHRLLGRFRRRPAGQTGRRPPRRHPAPRRGRRHPRRPQRCLAPAFCRAAFRPGRGHVPEGAARPAAGPQPVVRRRALSSRSPATGLASDAGQLGRRALRPRRPTQRRPRPLAGQLPAQ